MSAKSFNVIQNFLATVWGDIPQDPSVYCSRNFVHVDPTIGKGNLLHVLAFATNILDGYSELSRIPKGSRIEGKNFILEVEFSGVNDGPLQWGENEIPAQNVLTTVPVTMIFRLDENGKIVYYENVWDPSDFMRQLGLIG